MISGVDCIIIHPPEDEGSLKGMRSLGRKQTISQHFEANKGTILPLVRLSSEVHLLTRANSERGKGCILFSSGFLFNNKFDNSGGNVWERFLNSSADLRVETGRTNYRKTEGVSI